MKIAIASGKGGTGKTTVSVNLFHHIQKNFNVLLVDCDVEEPNDALFFSETEKVTLKQVDQQIPEIITDKCIFCGRCADWCEFNAVTVVKKLAIAEINPDLCHSCGACIVACNSGAIIEKSQLLGTVSDFIL